MKIAEWTQHRWLLTSIAAFAFSLSHLFIDFQIGLFGASSSSISVLQAVLVATIGVTYSVSSAPSFVGQDGGRVDPHLKEAAASTGRMSSPDTSMTLQTAARG